mmetsp:Transcript_32130/g.75456  ORF Transcript_32130/g.75456 Transcript_32130/m.75456 type:complete len:639 (-) Transcript_32130:161-2077(-)|eukprot:CAMPEP_0178439700 /NCGR_PEP_ID=MMETSP0689_2-20121128/36315_1 /TAXON_ID=160604 /ORGANISM="Amphidinium massartii, Strain CS-259" /LENGTH=638 /DNA_ID=CAMNT_0020062285 /DNA_START=19 /DNA_END=1935 /DNA_ORIENTATION=-
MAELPTRLKKTKWPSGYVPPGMKYMRFSATLIGFVATAHVAISMTFGSLKGDPYQWVLVCSTLGCPVLLGWLLQSMGIITTIVEFEIQQVAYYILVVADSLYMAMADWLLPDDLWSKGALAPAAFALWGYTLQLSRPSKRPTRMEQTWPLAVLAASVAVRCTWDSQMEGLLLKTWCISLGLQALCIVLKEQHGQTVNTNDQLLIERKVQQTLLSSAYDATMSISRSAASRAQSSMRLVFNGTSLDKLLAKELKGEPLSACIRHGIGQLNELMRVAEDSNWNSGVSGPLSHALITCVDSEGMEFDCDVCAVMQAPTSEEAFGSLLCGLRIVGEKRACLPSEEDKDTELSTCFSRSTSSGVAVQGSGGTAQSGASLVEEAPPASSWLPSEVKSWCWWAMEALALANPDDSDASTSPSSLAASGALRQDCIHSTHACELAWASLSQVPGVCAMWCERTTMCISAMTPNAAAVFSLQPGQHIAGAMPVPNHVTMLRKAAEIMGRKIQEQKPNSAPFSVRPPLSLTFKTASMPQVDMKVIIVTLPPGSATPAKAGVQPKSPIFLILQPPPQVLQTGLWAWLNVLPAQSMMSKSYHKSAPGSRLSRCRRQITTTVGTESLVDTLLPNDSASNAVRELDDESTCL